MKIQLQVNHYAKHYRDKLSPKRKERNSRKCIVIRKVENKVGYYARITTNKHKGIDATKSTCLNT